MRDEFSVKIKRILAGRVGYLCSNPNCKKPTCGPNNIPDKIVNIGVAAHITAASKEGPRYNPNLNSIQRKSLENGIWLCQNCAKLIDSNIEKYSILLLKKWKVKAEELAQNQIERNYSADLNQRYNLSTQLTTFSRVDFIYPMVLMENDYERDIVENSKLLFNMIACAYLETSYLIKRDDFYFALTLEPKKIEGNDFITGELITHLTPFAYQFGVLSDLLKNGEFDEFEILYNAFPTIRIKRFVVLGRFLPYRISRINPAKITIEYINDNTITFNGDLTTSDLVRYFALGVNGQFVVFDDQNEKEQTEKNCRLINKTIDGFDLSEIWINPDDPEKWDFAEK